MSVSAAAHTLQPVVADVASAAAACILDAGRSPRIEPIGNDSGNIRFGSSINQTSQLCSLFCLFLHILFLLLPCLFIFSYFPSLLRLNFFLFLLVILIHSFFSFQHSLRFILYIFSVLCFLFFL